MLNVTHNLGKISIRSHYAYAMVLLDANIQRRSHNQHLAACECVESSLFYIINLSSASETTRLLPCIVFFSSLSSLQLNCHTGVVT